MIVIRGIEEKVLIQRLMDGDQTAFELLFRFYYPGLVVFARNLVFDNAEAEEIVQDFFVHLWNNRKKVQHSLTLKNYLFVSVKNRAFNFLKREKIRERTLKELQLLTENDILYNPDIFAESELQEKIKTAVAKLPKRTHEIFVLNRVKGFSNDEIASQLNLSKRTVETQISKALKILRLELKEYKFLFLFF